MKRRPLSRLWGFIGFLIVLLILNILISYIDNNIYREVVLFLNANLVLSFVIMIFFLIGDIFYSIIFPLSLPAPIFSSIGAVLTLMYILRFFGLIDRLINSNIISSINGLIPLIYIIVFIVAFFGGYIYIIHRLFWNEDEREERRKEREMKKPKKGVEWIDVGEQFKLALYNLGETLKDAFKSKKKK